MSDPKTIVTDEFKTDTVISDSHVINLGSDDATDPNHDLNESKSGMYCSTE